MFTVATWNLHQAVDRRPTNMAATWTFLEEDLQPTVALVQEAHRLPNTSGGSVSSRSEPGYFTAVLGYGARVTPIEEVVTRYSRRHPFAIAPRVPGSFAAAQVDLPDGLPMVAISLYGIMAPLYAQTGILRAIADLIPLFDTPALNKRVVLGGDMNVYDQTPDRVMRERWLAIVKLVESLGLVNLVRHTASSRRRLDICPCRADDCWHVETFRHRRSGPNPGFFTNDYLFASPALTERLHGLDVVNDRADAWELSDHCPIVARFDL